MLNSPSHKDKFVLRNAVVLADLLTKKKGFKQEKNGFIWHSIGCELRGPMRNTF